MQKLEARMTMDPFKAACVQAAPAYMDLQGSVAKAVRLIERRKPCLEES